MTTTVDAPKPVETAPDPGIQSMPNAPRVQHPGGQLPHVVIIGGGFGGLLRQRVRRESKAQQDSQADTRRIVT